MRTARLLNPSAGSADDFPRQVLELQAWVTGQPLPPGHPGHGVSAFPLGPTSPDLWMLGSSAYGAQLAAHYGLPYAFAWFITDGAGAPEALSLYRQNFQPGVTQTPRAAVCVWALAADTEEEAWFQFRSRERARVDRLSGRFGPLQPPNEARRPWSDAEAAEAGRIAKSAFVGTGPQVRDKLVALAESLQAEELVVITWTWDPAAQRRSYELLAQAFGLEGSAGV
jgi:luciferase family oxidoreductase group 1